MCPERRNPDFSEERIEQAILGNLEQIEAGRKPAFTPRPKPPSYRPHPKYKGFLALYYHYCYLLGRIEKRQYPPRMTPHLRREIMKAETYKARLKFLQENSISTADDLTACMHQAESTVTQLAKRGRHVVPMCAVLRADRASVQVCATQTPRPPTVRRKKARAGIKPALALQIERGR